MVAVNTFQHNIPSSLPAHPPSAAQKVGTLKDLPPERKEDRWDERGGRRNVRWEALVVPKDDLQNLLHAIDKNGRLAILLTSKRRKPEGWACQLASY